MKLHLLEYGTNKEFAVEEIAPYNIPAVGEFFIQDTYAFKGWEDKMYIVKAVTRFTGDNVAIHVSKYDPVAEEKYWQNMVNKIDKIREKVDGSKKSEENN